MFSLYYLIQLCRRLTRGPTRLRRRGQGLAEYALVLSLVAIVVLVSLAILGQRVSQVYCDIINHIPGPAAACQNDAVTIQRAQYDPVLQEVHIDAFSDGGYNPSATLTATPGGPMAGHPAHNHYHIRFTQPGCPCNIVVSSSLGGSVSVTVP